MTPDELRTIMEFLTQRVQLEQAGTKGEVTIRFDAPTTAEMVEAGLDADGCKRLLDAPWWAEMVDDIVETPDMCDPDDPPEKVLEFARDVVSEYIRKRFKP